MVMKLIIDVDTGTDDALAIMVALAQSDVEVLAITCVHGNVRVNEGCRNTLRVLQTCDRLDIPVYKGAAKPLVMKSHPLTHYHGLDGLGDTSIDSASPVDISIIKEEFAAVAMVNLVNKYPGEVTLVALAPLTNLSLAQHLDPEFGKKLKSLLIMGGNITGRGNVSVSGEFNFFSDPEAARNVLMEFECPKQLVSWETCMGHTLDWEWFDRWTSTDTKKAKFVKAFLKSDATRQRDELKLGGFRCCDPQAIACLFYDGCVLESKKCYCTVELNGSLTRGQMVVDWNGVLGQEPNTEIISKINCDLLKNGFEAAIK
ncbi:nucleoside hydrolase-like isoform X2 [Lineus longissimus]|uniref:nucleoside hydrolase-like isoform X2 n=1 Tax=Lineus longissimus TaxID=88925 RepID=UPI002B4E3915